MVPFKTVSDSALVQKIYHTILAFPPNPTTPQRGSCTMNAQRVLYDLSFLKNTKLIQHGILSMTACGGAFYVSLDGTYKREFYSDRNFYVPFRNLLENAFGVTTVLATSDRRSQKDGT